MLGTTQTLDISFWFLIIPLMNMFNGIGRRITDLTHLDFWNGTDNGENHALNDDTGPNPPEKKRNMNNDKDKNPPGNRQDGKLPPLGDVLSRRLKILKDAIEEIDREIEERKKLTSRFREQIDSEARECKLLLDKLPYPWSQGYQPKTEFIRISLHKSLLTRRKDKMERYFFG